MSNPVSTSLLVLTAVSACFVAPVRAQEKPEDLMQSTLETYAAAWNAGDSHTLAELYTLDADYTGYGSIMTRGRGDIENRYAALLAGAFAGTHLTVKMSSLRFLKPDVAIVDGSLELTRQPAADGTPQASTGLFIAIMTDDEGQWRFTTFWSKRLQSASGTAPR